jgi:hypothetical protein
MLRKQHKCGHTDTSHFGLNSGSRCKEKRTAGIAPAATTLAVAPSWDNSRQLSSSSRALASRRSGVSKPSVNQPYTGESRSARWRPFDPNAVCRSAVFTPAREDDLADRRVAADPIARSSARRSDRPRLLIDVGLRSVSYRANPRHWHRHEPPPVWFSVPSWPPPAGRNFISIRSRFDVNRLGRYRRCRLPAYCQRPAVSSRPRNRRFSRPYLAIEVLQIQRLSRVREQSPMRKQLGLFQVSDVPSSGFP